MPTLHAAHAASRLPRLLHVDRLAHIYLLEHGHRHVAGHLQVLLAHPVLHALRSVLQPVLLGLLHRRGLGVVRTCLGAAECKRVSDFAPGPHLLQAGAAVHQVDVQRL